MKTKFFKTLVVLFMAILSVSCTCSCNEGTEKESVLVSINDEANYVARELERAIKIVTITTEGETHQYIYLCGTNQGGLTHLPNCKYCNHF